MAKKKKSLLSAKQKAWIASTVLTFLGGFVGTILPFLSTMSAETLTKSAGYALLIVAVRNGFKAINDAYFAPKA